MHEPRLKHVLGVGYAVAPVGADHMMNVHDTAFTRDNDDLKRVNSALPEDQKIPPLPAQVLNEDKVRLFVREVSWMHFQDCGLNCHFYPYRYEHMAEALSGVTGLEFGVDDVLAVGERAQTLSRLFNLREGFTADDDKLPKRLKKAFEKGPIAGKAPSEQDLAWAKRRYYEMMGWDALTGVPQPDCLERLELTDLLQTVQPRS